MKNKYQHLIHCKAEVSINNIDPSNTIIQNRIIDCKILKIKVNQYIEIDGCTEIVYFLMELETPMVHENKSFRYLILYNEFENLVMNIPDSIRNVIVVLHTSPFKECIMRKEPPSPIDAYEGSGELGKCINHLKNNRNVNIICGHRHKKLNIIKNDMHILRSAVGYLPKEDIDLNEISKKSIGIIEI